jgi:3-hydroxyacyl-CoA dehydrogenase/enoyl-CoA hydratase/3-hydroxybutyryl-CoA epimerase
VQTSGGASPNIGVVLGSDGVLVATIDMPGRSMNVFSAGLMDSLERLLDQVEASPDIKAVVLRSGKSAFLAGADLEMVRTYTERARTDSPEDLHKLCGRLGRLFRRLETNGKPFVAAINGLALGGGLELALACHERIAAGQAEVGLPEIKLGLLPGAGGTQRLPRLIGKRFALQLMLRGDPLPATKAHSLGIVDAVVPAEHLVEHARARALARAANGAAQAPWDAERWLAPVHPNTLEEGDDDLARVFEDLGIEVAERRRYPAYAAIMECVAGGWYKAMDDACNWEMDCFVRLIRHPTAGNMIRCLFLDRQRAAKLISLAPTDQPRAVVQGADAEPVRALLRASRVEILETNSPPPGCLVIVTDDEARSCAANPELTVRWLQATAAAPAALRAGPAVWVSELTPYGRAVEVVADPEGPGKLAGLQIARWLRATPVLSRGASLLGELAAARTKSEHLPEDEGLLAVALAAAKTRCRIAELDTGIADSAAVIAGLFPAYAGGPFTYLRQHGRTDAG